MASPRVVPVRRRRRPTQSGEVLSAELIVRTAMRLIDQSEGAGFSVRSLGTALGCDPTALYRYFHNTEDLMRAVTDALIGDAFEDYEPDPDWQVALREFAHRVYNYAQRHPRIALVGASRVSLRSNEFRAVDTGLGLFLSAGFSPSEAVRYYHAFIDLVLGYAALDASASALSQDDWTSAYTSLPASEYPHVAAVRDEIGGMTGSAFETALGLLLQSVAIQSTSATSRHGAQ